MMLSIMSCHPIATCSRLVWASDVLGGLHQAILLTALQSPIDAAESRDEIEVPVSAQHWKRVLAAESRNPNVMGRNRGSGSFEFTANDSIRGRCLLIYVQHPELRKVFDKPVFVASPLARLLDTISVFAQDDARNSD
jgi:hypothetical protein